MAPEPTSEQMRRALDLASRGRRARWWRRRGSRPSGFWYEDHDGSRVTAADALERIRRLALPPAWKGVRIAPSPRSRLQAVGVDAAGRLQYRYLSDFAARRSREKYGRVLRFGEALPRLRRVSNEDLCRGDLSRQQVLAVVVRLIDQLNFRPGSERSVRRYRTYGVTSLRNRHVQIGPRGELQFSFVAKHQVRQRRVLVDETLATLLARLKELGGARLFEYVGPDGRIRAITPADVNGYIKEALGPEFTSKDFRTWRATLEAAVALSEMGPAATEAQVKRNVAQACRRVADRLGNTPSVCRASYIHPDVVERYRDGVTLAEVAPRGRRRIRGQQPDYEPEEVALIALLRGPSHGAAAAA